MATEQIENGCLVGVSESSENPFRKQRFNDLMTYPPPCRLHLLRVLSVPHLHTRTQDFSMENTRVAIFKPYQWSGMYSVPVQG